MDAVGLVDDLPAAPVPRAGRGRGGDHGHRHTARGFYYPGVRAGRSCLPGADIREHIDESLWRCDRGRAGVRRDDSTVNEDGIWVDAGHSFTPSSAAGLYTSTLGCNWCFGDPVEHLWGRVQTCSGAEVLVVHWVVNERVVVPYSALEHPRLGRKSVVHHIGECDRIAVDVTTLP